MKLHDKLMDLHLHRAPYYTNCLLILEVIDKNNIYTETIDYLFGEEADVFRRLGNKLQWEVIDAFGITDAYGYQIILRIREKEEMKEYTIIKSDIADLKGDTVDWSKVKVDTKILVRNYEQEDWSKRYFAKYENERVFTWSRGKTSWSVCDKEVIDWNYAKLAEEEEND
jgi:hypothetical protein